MSQISARSRPAGHAAAAFNGALSLSYPPLLCILLLCGALFGFSPGARGAGDASDATAPASQPAPGASATNAPSGAAVKMLDPEELHLAALAKAQDLDTEALWLETQRESFLALYHADNTGNPKGGVILLHDTQTSPDWPELVRPLRLGLPEQGWPTLSIALPDAPIALPPPRSDETPSAAGSDPAERIRERLERASQHLMSQGYLHLILLGIGSGAHWAVDFAGQSAHARNMSVMMVDPAAAPGFGESDFLNLLGQLKSPVLDLYHANPRVQELAEQRARRRQQQALRLHQAGYHQLRLPATPANWKLANRRLLSQVRGVLLRHVENQPRLRAEEPAKMPTELAPGQ